MTAPVESERPLLAAAKAVRVWIDGKVYMQGPDFEQRSKDILAFDEAIADAEAREAANAKSSGLDEGSASSPDATARRLGEFVARMRTVLESAYDYGEFVEEMLASIGTWEKQ